MEPHSKTAIYVERPLYQQEELNAASRYEKPTKNCRQKTSSCIHSFNCWTFIKSLIPILTWLPEYNLSDDLVPDIVAGITVAVMHIPQGIAYGMLGNLPPIHGIYMAFFPVLVYTALGTSRHNSMGTFAIICLMTGKAVTQYSSDDIGHSPINTTDVTGKDDVPRYTGLQVATAVTFTVGLIHLLMFVCRLGILCTLLSTTLVNAFTTGSAVHVMMTQIKDLLGLTVPKRRGYFRNGFALYDMVFALPHANLGAVIISAVAVTIIVINNELIKPRMSKITRFPIPIELIMVTFGTIISYTADISGKWGVNLVGDIPTGLPEPTLPTFSLMGTVAIDAFSIAVVSYVITMSMAFMFAQKMSYEVDSNQELFAMGMSNIFGSLFACMPITASLSRSLIQNLVGGVTQITSVVSCLILLVILLWVGPVFQYLPRAILASIIVVALKGMLVQAKLLVKFWHLSKLDAMVWVITFLGVVLVDIEIGLVAGTIASILILCYQSFGPNTCLLGVVPNTEIYLDMRRYKGVEEIDGIKIFHFVGGINFASRAMFKSELLRRVEIDAKKVRAERKKRARNLKTEYLEEENLLVQYLILDLSAVNYIDPAGVEQLRLIQNEYKSINIKIYLASASGLVYETLQRCDSYEYKKSTFVIFPTVHDAVLHAKENLIKNGKNS